MNGTATSACLKYVKSIIKKVITGDSMNDYDNLKSHFGKVYSGMKVTGTHEWDYNKCKCSEQKVHPDVWVTSQSAIKKRTRDAPKNSGVPVNTKYHWLWIGDQIATKLNENEYDVRMQVLKFKVGHKRPYWKMFSYMYDGQLSYLQRVEMYTRKVLKAVMLAQNKKIEVQSKLTGLIALDGSKLLE